MISLIEGFYIEYDLSSLWCMSHTTLDILKYELDKNTSWKKKLSFYPFFLVVQFYLPSPSNIWILASGKALNKLGSGPASLEIYSRGSQHSAVFEIVLPCKVP